MSWQITRYDERELAELSLTMLQWLRNVDNAVRRTRGQGRTSAPNQPQDGEIFYTDGVDWDPIGEGAGYYGYLNGQYILLSASQAIQGYYDQLTDTRIPQGSALDAASNYQLGDYYVITESGVFVTPIPELNGLSAVPGDQVASDGTEWVLLTGIGDFLSRRLDDTAQGVITFAAGAKSTPAAPVAVDDLTRKDYVDGKDNSLQNSIDTHISQTTETNDVHGSKTYTDTEVQNRLLGWEVDNNPGRDLYPVNDDAYIGLLEKPLRGIAVGRHSATPPNIEGVVQERGQGPDEAGIAVVGFRDDPDNPPDPGKTPGAQASAPVEIAGTEVLLMAKSALLVETGTPVNEPRYVLIGESQQLADGRIVAPLEIGPQYVPSQKETATDTRDIDLDDAGTIVPVVALTTVNSYVAINSTLTFQVNLSEENGRTTIFTVGLYLDTLYITDWEVSLSGTQLLFQRSFVLQSPLSAGAVIELRVDSVGTHPQSDGWVRGAGADPSVIEITQG